MTAKGKRRTAQEKEEQHEEKEEQRKEKEEMRKARDHLFNKWECIQLYIRQMAKDMKYETNEVLENNIHSDIVGLLNSEKLLANMLIFN